MMAPLIPDPPFDYREAVCKARAVCSCSACVPPPDNYKHPSSCVVEIVLMTMLPDGMATRISLTVRR